MKPENIQLKSSCRYFCEVAKLTRNEFKSVHVRKLCSNWVAVYEEWTVVEPVTRQLSVCISLDPQEIALQISQSGCERFSGFRQPWSIQFPVAVSPEKRVFAVLRTVYRLSVSKDMSTCTQGQVLPLDNIDSFGHSGPWTRSPILRLANESSAYLYTFSFSKSGRYLYFLDNECAGLFRILVFEQDSNYHGKYQLRNQQRIDFVVPEDSPYDIQLKLGAHPNLPLAVVAILGAVYIWDWTDGRYT